MAKGMKAGTVSNMETGRIGTGRNAWKTQSWQNMKDEQKAQKKQQSKESRRVYDNLRYRTLKQENGGSLKGVAGAPH